MPRELRDDGRTYHDVAHALAVQDARSLVVEKARAWSHGNGGIVDRVALHEAVRALDAVERGEP
jgi:hypothetical protein